MTQEADAMSEPTESPTTQLPGSAVLFYAIAVGLVAWGVFTMFYYDPGPIGSGRGEIVGGDAYNYIIIATRGVGFIASGIGSAILGLGVQVYQLVQVTAEGLEG